MTHAFPFRRATPSPLLGIYHARSLAPLCRADAGYTRRVSGHPDCYNMWPFLIVFFPPSFDDVFGFLQPREPVLVQAFVTELAIEAFAERILYWLSRH